jgi:hypothetical protein
MAFTRRAFFGRVAAVAVGAVLAARPRVSPKPIAATFQHRAYGGVVFITDENMNRDRVMFISEQYRELLGREASRAEIVSWLSKDVFNGA